MVQFSLALNESVRTSLNTPGNTIRNADYSSSCERDERSMNGRNKIN